MVTVLDWPSVIPPPMSSSWYLRPNTMTPGPGLSGHQQVITRENRVWTNTVQLTELWKQRANVFSAFLDDVKGMFGLIRMPVVNSGALRYWGDDAAFYAQFGVTPEMQAVGIPFSDGALFSDGVGFALPDHEDPVVVADAPAGATLLTLSGLLGENLGIGCFFSIGDFLYRVADNDSGAIRFNPPLRVDAAAGAIAKVNKPTIIVRLEQDAQARVTLAQRWRGSVPSFDVVEAFQR